MSRAPAAFLTIGFCAGLVIARSTAISLGPAMAGFAIALLCAAVRWRFFSAPSTVRQAVLFIACGLLGVWRYSLVHVEPPDAVQRFANANQPVVFAGEVISAPLKGKPLKGRPQGDSPQLPETLWRCTLLSQAIYFPGEKRWQPAAGKVLASGTHLDSLGIGDKVLLIGELDLPNGERNPGEFDYREYLAAQGITALLRCRDTDIIWQQPAKGFLWREQLQRVRDDVSQRIHQFAGGDQAGLIRGLLLGEREEIPEEIRDAFARTGLIHILAVSGLHVGFVLLIALALGDVVRLPQLPKTLWAGVALIFFAALTGFNPPVVRATIMALIFLCGRLLERRGNLFNTVALAALIILLGEPRQLFQIGFQLSFAAVLGIGYLYQPILSFSRRLLSWPRLDWLPAAVKQLGQWILSLLAVSLAAQLTTAPIIAHAFGRVPALAIWGNLVIIPLAFWLVASATVACTIMPLWKFAGEAFGAAADLAAMVMLGFTRWLANTPGAYVDGVLLTIPVIVLFILAIVTLVEWRSPLRRLLMPAFLLAANIFLWRSALAMPVKLRATFFDIGQGDAALVEYADGKKMLIDGGPRQPGFDAGSRTIVPFLRRQGIRHLDAVIVTHPHNDHVGGVPAVLRSVPVDTVYECGVADDLAPQSELAQVIDSLRVPRRALHAGRRLRQFAPVEVLILHPPAHSTAPSLNDASVVVRMICGRVSFLFSGDAEIWAETRMAKYDALLDSDILKVGHHGSRTSSSPQFIAQISPAWAIVSVGKRNRFGHPNVEVMDRLKISGAQVVRLDENGAAIFCTDGRKLWRER